jgi:hypothetical protein
MTINKPSDAIKHAFEIGVKAREWVVEERAALKERYGLDVRMSTAICPICQLGHFTWMVMPNDHIHMHCSKDDCVQWIE